MNKLQNRLLALLGACLLAGCSSVPLETGGAPVESRSATPVGGAASGGGRPSRRVREPRDVGRPDEERVGGAEQPAARSVYFDFDSFVVKDEYRPAIEANAKALTADRKKHVTVEGHTDDRGGREYNLALGQKRAEAVAKSLQLLGVNDIADRRRSASARSARRCRATTKRRWAKNRRADIVYR